MKKKYRRLVNELVQVGDIATSDGTPESSSVISREGDSCIGRNSNIQGWDNDFWYREVKEDNWIAFSDRKPTKEDANEDNCIIVRSMSGAVGVRNINTVGKGREWEPGPQSYWMPLNFIPREPTRIKVDGHEVVPSKDGSIKVGCQTVSSQDFEEIVRQRNEAMK